MVSVAVIPPCYNQEKNYKGIWAYQALLPILGRDKSCLLTSHNREDLRLISLVQGSEEGHAVDKR